MLLPGFLIVKYQDAVTAINRFQFEKSQSKLSGVFPVSGVFPGTGTVIPTQDRIEGLKAFAEKKKPEYVGA